MSDSPTRILVLCTGNSCRSQMAEGWLRRFAGDRAAVFSAGVETHGVNPKAVRVMAEAGVDLSGHTSDHVDAYRGQPFDHVVTVCDSARERCPWFPTEAQQHHRSFPDPARARGSEEEVLEAFRAVRDAVRDWARAFVAEHVGEPAA
ncbi:MAG: arsenate reductase ArsC [Rhodothermales bacterium]|nr:arsenate reductase ArsC [Rhodothermales bacterium]